MNSEFEKENNINEENINNNHQTTEKNMEEEEEVEQIFDEIKNNDENKEDN